MTEHHGSVDSPAQRIMLDQLVSVLHERGWQQFITFLGIPLAGEFSAPDPPTDEQYRAAVESIDTLLRCFIGLDENY